MKKEIMKNILSYVKDEFKDKVQFEVEKMTRDFLNLSDEEKETVYDTDGTIGYIFGSPQYEEKLSFNFEDVMINYNDETESELCDLIIDYLHYHIDEDSNVNSEMYLEDDRFIIEYHLDNIYTVIDKVKNEEYVLDNVDSDTSIRDLLQMLYNQVEDEEDN